MARYLLTSFLNFLSLYCQGFQSLSRTGHASTCRALLHRQSSYLAPSAHPVGLMFWLKLSRAALPPGKAGSSPRATRPLNRYCLRSWGVETSALNVAEATLQSQAAKEGITSYDLHGFFHSMNSPSHRYSLVSEGQIRVVGLLSARPSEVITVTIVVSLLTLLLDGMARPSKIIRIGLFRLSRELSRFPGSGPYLLHPNCHS